MAIPLSYQAQGVTLKNWTDWRWQLMHVIRSIEELKRHFPISLEKEARISLSEQAGLDEMRLTPYLVSLMDLSNQHDPIARQHLPDARELINDEFSFEKVWEQVDEFNDGANRFLQQKYPDIMVMRISNTCHSFCRFCFEKERTLRHDVPTTVTPNQFEEAIAHIAKKTQVRQILISGGDPLVLPDEILKKRLESLIAIPHLSIIRINTRVYLHNPFRITKEFASMLENLQTDSWQQTNRTRGIQIHLGTHFNHPKELTPEALAAIRTLQKHNIQVYNQSVVLKGINDTTETFQTLFRRLREEGVRLHYLSHAMAVPGTRHLRTTVRKCQDIMRRLRQCGEFRGQLPHLEMGHFKGKQIIPDTMNEYFYEETLEKDGRKYPIIRFLSDITGAWEIFPDGD